MADGFKIASAFVQVDPNTDGFKERLQAALDEAIAGANASVPIGANLDDLNAKIDQARQKLDDLKSEHPEAKIGANDDDLDAKTQDAKAKLDEFEGREAKAKLGADDADFTTKTDDANAKLDEFDGKEATARLGLNKDEFDAEMDAAEARLEAFKAESADANLGGSGGSGGGAGGAASGAEGGGGLLGGITGGVAALMPGIGGATTGLGMLAGTGALAFGGIAQAVSAAHQASQSIGMSQQQLASTEFSNSVQIQNAQQAVGQAHRQAAQDAITSASQIQSAEMNLAETERNAAASMIAAQQAVGQAEHSLADAQYTEQQAQVSLTEARIQATQQLQQLNDQVKDAALSERSASLAVQQAKYQQTLTDQNAYSTSLDRQQASLAVAQAEQQLVEATQNKANVTTEASAKDKQYFDGSQQVIQAQQALKDATYGVGQAQQQVANAQRALTNTELNNADAVKQAQLAVSQAQEQAAYQQKQDAIAVQQAEQNVTNTIKEQRLALAATKASANQAAEQFTRDMAKLTPAGRGFVNELLSMRGAYRGLEAAAQNSVLPGMDVFLRGIKSLMPTVTGGVRTMGHAISDAFGQFGKEMQTPQFQKVLSGLMREGTSFVNTVLPAIGQFISELAKIGSENGASSGLANLLAGLMRGFTGLATVIGQNEKPINELLTAIGRILTAAGPELGSMLGVFVRVLEPLTMFLNSGAGKPFVSLLGDVVAGFLAWKLAQAAVIGPFGKLIKLPEQFGQKWDKAGEIYHKIMGPGGTVEGATTKAGTVIEKLGQAGSKAWDGITTGATGGAKLIGRFGSSVGTTMSNAASAVSDFVVLYAGKLKQAAIDTAAWVGEHAIATGAFVAENTVQMASATAAYIAENAATLGIAAGITALVGVVIYLGLHWRQVWGDVKHWAEDAWHFIYDGFGKWLLPLLGPAGLVALGVIELAQHWRQIWGDITGVAEAAWRDVLDPLFHGIVTGARDMVSGFESVWDRLEGIFKRPVNFLIGTVYDKGIARLWNDVVTHIGLGSIKLPIIPQMAAGGIVPGTDHGRDEKLVAMRPEEGVIVPEAVRAIGGPGVVHALNNTYGRGGSETKPGGGFAGGGILGSIGGAISGIGHDLMSGAKFAAEVATNPVKAVEELMQPVIGTSASGDLGRVMTGIPKAIVSSLAKSVLSSMVGGGGQSSPGHVTGTVASWFEKAVKLTGVGAGWIPDLETIAHYESDDNADAINNSDSNAAAGDPSRGIMQAIMSTFLAYHQAGTSMNIYDPVANIAAAIRYIKSRYGTVGDVPGIVSLAHGGPYVGYDSGGWLPPSGQMPGGMPVNMLGQPEAVLTPQESAAFVAIAKRLTADGVGQGLGGTTVVQNFNGTQWPNAEQIAAMKREMALALSGP